MEYKISGKHNWLNFRLRKWLRFHLPNTAIDVVFQ